MIPVKKNLRRMKTEWLLKIKEEVTKQLKVGFIKPVHQVEWIANIVPVPKKDGKVRMFVDFRDLNKACSKDDFLLPHIDVLVDNMAGSALMSFMDDFSRYNQIKIAPKDQNYFHYRIRNLLLHSDAVWPQECGGNLPKDGRSLVTLYDA